MSDEVTYRRQITDYWGTLQTSLRNLRGFGALAYELIQNADDVLDEEGHPGATRIAFDVCKDALIVENDGVFREVDYDRMANIASGGKREEDGTTGAFGIGFISVYQITDSPEIFSSGRHWRIRPDAPEDMRIEERRVQTQGTRFRLPWAFEPDSEVRRRLRAEAVRPDRLQSFAEEISQAISRAALFLKYLELLELKVSGKLVKRIERQTESEDAILVAEGDETCCWHIFRGAFDDEAKRLRSLYRMQIEEKKGSKVVVAIPDEPLDSGRLYAVLPTDTNIPLPFHVNADFYPSSDRKRIILESDFQSEWNRAAIRAAAQALVDNIEKLPDLLGHRILWKLIKSLDECHRAAVQGESDLVFSAFWQEIAPCLADWAKPHEARLLSSESETDASSILVELGINVVHSDLREHFGLLQQVGVPLLTVHDVVQALEQNGLQDGMRMQDAPAGLESLDARQRLWLALDAVYRRSQQTSSARAEAESALRNCPIGLDSTGHWGPPDHLFRAEVETQLLFEGIRWLGAEVDASGMPADLVSYFSAQTAIEFLAHLPTSQLEARWQEGELDILALYRWFEERKQEILADAQFRRRLRGLATCQRLAACVPSRNCISPAGLTTPSESPGWSICKRWVGVASFSKIWACRN